MNSKTKFLVCTVFAAFFAVAECQKVCSVDDPKPNQVCISVKFPWEVDPVFFCTEHGKINYTPQCNDPSQSHHCFDDGRNDTLKIATPWDCCPLISTPNHCANTRCPPQPYNRKCKEIKILGACCPTYYCDDGEPDNCKSSRLKSSCLTAPADKKNCTVFRDPFGCCNKYQCKSQEKPGSCPRLGHHHHHHHHHHHRSQQQLPVHHAYVHAQKQVSAGASLQLPAVAPIEHPQHHHHHHHHHHGNEERSAETAAAMKRIAHGFMMEAKRSARKVAMGVKSRLESHGGPVGRYIAGAMQNWFDPATTMSPFISAAPLHATNRRMMPQHVPGVVQYRMAAGVRMAAHGGGIGPGGGFAGVGAFPHPPIFMNPSSLMRCIGDNTCPGTMKCCSGMSVYAAKYNANLGMHASSVNPLRLHNPFIRTPHFDQDGHHQPIDGFCVEPESEQKLREPTVSISTSHTNHHPETISTVQPIASNSITTVNDTSAPAQSFFGNAEPKEEPLGHSPAVVDEKTRPAEVTLKTVKSAPIIHETQATDGTKVVAPVAVDGDVYIRA